MRKRSAPRPARKEFEARLVQAVADLGREEETIRDTDGVLGRGSAAKRASLQAAQEQRCRSIAREAALKLQEAADALARAQEAADQANLPALRPDAPSAMRRSASSTSSASASPRFEREAAGNGRPRPGAAGASWRRPRTASASRKRSRRR